VAEKIRSKLVLVCEDDKTTLTVIAKIVEACGFVPICVDCGELAWKIFELNPQIEMIISDIGLPDFDGRELIRKMRGVSSKDEKPIIVLSGIITPNEIASLLDIGVTRFLPKPLVRTDLVEAIQKSALK
jgi:CheY-like chemotaxis protein